MTLQWKGPALVDKTQWGVMPWEDRILVARGALAVHAAAAAPVLPVEAPTGDLGGAAQAHIREEILTPCPRPPPIIMSLPSSSTAGSTRLATR